MNVKYKNIYLLTPHGLETGGVEALLQLAHAINLLKGNAHTLLFPDAKGKLSTSYKNYNIKRVQKISDSHQNLLIVPEIWTEYLDRYQKINKAIWWLSVDNNFGKFTDFKNRGIQHYTQSHYASNYLKEKGVDTPHPLFDYLNDAYFSGPFSETKKEDMVCYNPKKGNDISSKIKEQMPEVNFIALDKMKPETVRDCLKKSKIYIDFGHHPGKDRIPREAAVYNNCIITSKSGAAQNNFDIPINSEYKFEKNQANEIAAKIKECLLNHAHLQKDFDAYRKQIWNQKEQFFNQVSALFI